MKIAIIGTAEHSRLKAPYDDNGWQVWTVGGGFVDLPRQDKHFELHRFDDALNLANNKPFIDNMKQVRGDLYLQSPCVDLPDAKIFPHDEMVARFPRRYFTSTVAWMLAYAMSKRPVEIGLWGVDMEATEEYGYQKCGAEYLMGMAEGAGIKITLPAECPLLKANTEYAYGNQEFMAELTRRFAEAELIKKRSDERLQIAKDNQRYSEGYLDALKGIRRRCL